MPNAHSVIVKFAIFSANNVRVDCHCVCVFGSGGRRTVFIAFTLIEATFHDFWLHLSIFSKVRIMTLKVYGINCQHI
jgi:hypothetical protein